ncbi:hypothetical protein ISM37_004515 [Salmonella enterica]|uniref:TraC family protein n=1 Tax=Escherichia coli TaxID=562 RepID=UPI0006A5FC67|nr:TraC family protein [Escherichia coli]EGN7253089.1 hypothetical protein [Salmonella enterica]EGN7527258.1 hypothetical protein [Salmonella enterica]EGO6832878.1 hypothetical protein [Salmonella enterica]EGO6840265.1 hypothetical protein [Salmonella enterica]EGO6860194.1 hypothetical protein [Salmonella enterica]
MARKPLSAKKSEALAKLEAAKAELEKIEKAEAERVGRLAVRAGLTDLDLSDDDLIAAFKDVAARFQRKSEAVQTHTSTTSHSESGNGTGTGA